jgi:hypothetical protein
MVEVTYHCPHCGAVTTLERRARLADKSVTAEPLDGWEYAATTEAFEEADGVELVCLGDADAPERPAPGGDSDDGPDATADGCGRTYYLSFVKYADGEELDPSGEWLEDDPNFEFLR